IEEFPLRRMVHGMVPHSWCLECSRAYFRAGHYKRQAANNERSLRWLESNRDKARAASNKWKSANRDRMSAYNKAQYDANAEAMRARTAVWKKANPDLANTQNR